MGGVRRGRADYFKPGTWNAYCSMCGRKRKADEMERNWQGLRRCPEHNERRQPQDFARGVKDIMTVPWAQPATDLFVNICTLSNRSAIPFYAMPGCSIPGYPQLDPNPDGISRLLLSETSLVLETERGGLISTEGPPP